MRTFAFLINHGVEVRHFLLSGLIDELRTRHQVVILLRAETNSPALNHYIETYQVPVVQLPYASDLRKRHRNEHYLSKIRKARKARLGIGNYHNFRNENESASWKNTLMGNKFSFWFAHQIWAPALQTHYKSEPVVNFLNQQNITDLVLLDYNSPFQLMHGFSANEAGIQVHIVMNTLKTYFTNDYLPFQFKRLYAWDAEQQQLFQKSNPQWPAERVVNGGNPYYSFFLNARFRNEEQELENRYPELKERDCIVYSLIYEKMFDGEYELLLQLNDVLVASFPENTRPVVVIRRNPFEETDTLVKKLKQLPTMYVTGHYWERDVSKEWSIQELQGEREWKWILSKAVLCMNIPSMAGYESILSGTPVLNIGFDADGNPSVQLKQFTEAPFMRSFNQSQFIEVCTSRSELQRILPDWLRLKRNSDIETIRNSIAFTPFTPASFDLN